MTSTSSPTTRNVRGGALIAAAMGVMNIATYGYTILVAHLTGPAIFGAFSALMGAVLVVNVLSLGLQATGARRIAASPERAAAIERVVLSVSYRSSLGLGLLCLALAPLLDRVLRLESLPTAMLVAAVAVPLTIMGGQAGVLQGERRWAPLGVLYLCQGLGRVIFGLGLLLIWRTEFAAMLGVALGAWLPVLVGWIALRSPRSDRPPASGDGITLLREVTVSSQALLAFFALSNADVLLARAVLDRHDAGLYAGGLILVKAILFLPQFVVVIAFPSMSRPGNRGSTLVKGLAIVVGIGVVAVLAVLALPDLALVFVGGREFDQIKPLLWMFGIIGTLLSMIQLLLYSALARRQWLSMALIWASLAVLLALSPMVHSVPSLAVLVVCVDGTLLALLCLRAWFTRHS